MLDLISGVCQCVVKNHILSTPFFPLTLEGQM